MDSTYYKYNQASGQLHQNFVRAIRYAAVEMGTKSERIPEPRITLFGPNRNGITPTISIVDKASIRELKTLCEFALADFNGDFTPPLALFGTSPLPPNP